MPVRQSPPARPLVVNRRFASHLLAEMFLRGMTDELSDQRANLLVDALAAAFDRPDLHNPTRQVAGRG